MEVFIGWFVFSVVVGVIASSRGRSGIGWTLLALLLSPLIIGLLVIVLPSKRARDADGTVISPATHVKCPDCRAFIPADAAKCRHCGTRLIPQQSA